MGNFSKYIIKAIAKSVAKILITVLRPQFFTANCILPLWEKHGFHVLPFSFYSPIPTPDELNPVILSRQSELVGINMREAAQSNLITTFKKFEEEYLQIPLEATEHLQYSYSCGSFKYIDGMVLYCMIRHFRPRRIFEIGSGYTTLLSAQTVLKNLAVHGIETDLVAIEPYPSEFLKKGFLGLTKLIQKKVQDVPQSYFHELGENDILFIDSSHVVKIGSDVHYEYLEILPRLQKGVIVHIHDIFLPAEYPSDWLLENRWFWNEQYFLQAFLQFNDSFEILWAGSFMHLNYPEILENVFPAYDRNTMQPGSFWIRKIR